MQARVRQRPTAFHHRGTEAQRTAKLEGLCSLAVLSASVPLW